MSVATKLNSGKSIHYSTALKQYRNFFISLFIVLIIAILTAIWIQFWAITGEGFVKYEKIKLNNLGELPEIKLVEKDFTPSLYLPKCTYWDCFNIYRCGRTGHDRIAVYVYPPKRYVNENGLSATKTISKEFYTILDTVIQSKYYTSNPDEACIFVPSIDTLNQMTINLNLTSAALKSLQYWNDGENHLIFNMIAGEAPNFSNVIEVNTGRAIIAGADLDTYTYRVGFDIKIPVYSPVAVRGEQKDLNFARDHFPRDFQTEVKNIFLRRLAAPCARTWMVTSSQINIDPYYMDALQELSFQYPELLILDECTPFNYTQRCEVISGKKYVYPEVLKQSTFCLMFRGERMGQFVLLEALAANCIPVVVIDSPVMPFGNVLDWKRSSIFIMEEYLHTLMDVLKAISEQKIVEMRKQVRFLYETYFSSIRKITETTLDIIQDRVYPHWTRTYDDWNLRPNEIVKNPLHLPITANRSQGFTAVILTYDRIESLFLLIEKLSKVPSLMKVLVVWNNQKKSPPPEADFPKILKPVKVIKMTANKLSNRFYPFEEIQTEAVLSIDDDIVMLTADELEFGYEVWREFPDRIVGFPSRTHIWDNVTNSWKYESEWTNEISMVLTGAAFYHKYWNYVYTTGMPSEIKDWVDEHMNCEDIAMNFLVSNVTNKPPIKVAPRKKFKCPECVNNEMLSADLGHMVERSQCIHKFAQAFGRMPLKTVEFRADPVLFKDVFPEKLKRFNDIGSL